MRPYSVFWIFRRVIQNLTNLLIGYLDPIRFFGALTNFNNPAVQSISIKGTIRQHTRSKAPRMQQLPCVTSSGAAFLDGSRIIEFTARRGIQITQDIHEETRFSSQHFMQKKIFLL
ncbi:hypothetical protein LF63_0113275 [Oleiagrimonas soli]|uniref:Uncharacterized protein n=1 Tax=Oleiagrimonas soli TaxID=1543381 RepID=A0A099CT84_9GAMM|nr:hypothetical protein LF63_0113275 [Oleiagrimonas soli]